jgi:Mn2+/Fe2+ NRAMP family transporter
MNQAKKNYAGALLGAAFLMATSAIGPGFLTQTTVFTEKLMASFGFVILLSILLDIGAQLNIWRIISASGKRAQDIAEAVYPGMGKFLSLLIVLGGFAFNIGNIAGTELATITLFNRDTHNIGAVASAGIAIAIFLIKEAGVVLDWFTKLLGFVMIGLTLYVAIYSQPPLAEAAYRSFVPEKIDWNALLTIVGGTVGGYITFAGAHRLLDAGISGIGNLPRVQRSAVTAIGLASVMRILLFLAALGVFTMHPIAHDAFDDELRIAPDYVFEAAVGEAGRILFGIVMWAAAITSVVGASYTSVSFLRSLHPKVEAAPRRFIIFFIIIAAAVFVLVGKPVKVLLLAGAVNGLILPAALVLMLLAAHKKQLMGNYKHPRWLTVFGIVVAVAMAWMGLKGLVEGLGRLVATG